MCRWLWLWRLGKQGEEGLPLLPCKRSSKAAGQLSRVAALQPRGPCDTLAQRAAQEPPCPASRTTAGDPPLPRPPAAPCQILFGAMFAYADAFYNGPVATFAHAVMSATLTQAGWPAGCRPGAGWLLGRACGERQCMGNVAGFVPQVCSSRALAGVGTRKRACLTAAVPALYIHYMPAACAGLVPGPRRDLECAHLVPVGPDLCHDCAAARGAWQGRAVPLLSRSLRLGLPPPCALHCGVHAACPLPCAWT